MEFDLCSKVVVFVVDDDSNALWVQVALHALTELCSGWTIEALSPPACGASNDGNTIVKYFSSRIVEIASSGGLDSVFVVTDSTFGTNPEIRNAGFQLLLNCSIALKQLFKCGVVYSTAPHGNSQSDRIELMSRTRNPSADFAEISAFFKSGSFLSPTPIIEVLKPLSCLSLIIERLEHSANDRLYRPMCGYGVPSIKTGEYVIDPLLETSTSCLQPFAPGSIRHFRQDSLNVLTRILAKRNGNTQSISNSVNVIKHVLCPYYSIFSAVSSWAGLNPDFGCGKGALRLVWDLAMTGNESTILRRDYFRELNKAHHAPNDIICTLDKYLKIVARFSNDIDGRMFKALIRPAVLEWHKVNGIIQTIDI